MYVRNASVLALLFSGFVYGDQVTLKNGDIVSGSVIRKDGDKLYLKSDLLGEVSMPWSAITSVKSDTPLHVVLPSGQGVNGPVTTQGTDLQVHAPQAMVSSPIGQVGAIRNAVEQQRYLRMQNPSWLDLWAGYADLGYALARGNARTTTLTTAFLATRVTKNDKTSVFFNQIHATATVNQINGTTADAARGGISYDHNITPRLFFNVTNTDEYDSFQNLNFRLVAGGGLGYHLIKTERTLLDILGGVDYTHENFSTGLSRNAFEVYGGNDLNYKLSGITSLTQAFRIFDAPSSGRYRMNFDIGADTVIHKWLSWQVTATDRYLSEPVFGRKKNDLLLTTGIRVTFAQ